MQHHLFAMSAFSEKRNVSIWRPSVCLSHLFDVSKARGVIFTARRYVSAVYAIVVCPSVRPSVTYLYCTKTAKIKFSHGM